MSSGEIEPPSQFTIRREYFSHKVRLFVVRDRGGNFITAMGSRNEASGWILKHENNNRRRYNS